MNGNIVNRVRIINYTRLQLKYEIETDTGKLLAGYLNGNSSGSSTIHTILYNSSWLEVTVLYQHDNSLIEKKRITL